MPSDNAAVRVSRPDQSLLPPLRAGRETRTAAFLARMRRIHPDERGTISILTVVVLLAFTMILGMIINVGREVDDKVRLQNAADAATYSSGVVVARGMNAIAFTNHLLCEVFAMTAYMREGRDRGSEAVVPEILAAWEKIGPMFARAQFPKFARLGPAITAKVPLEREVIRTFGEMTAMKSQIMLPALEYILGQPESQGGDPQTHLIPQFQRAVVQATPLVAQATMQEIAARHGPSEPGRSVSGSRLPSTRTRELSGVFWRSRAMAAGESLEDDPYQRTLPAVDPTSSGIDASRLNSSERTVYQTQATIARRDLSRHYLEQWIGDPSFDLGPFEREGTWDQDGTFQYLPGYGGQISAKMSQFANLWRIFACGQLEQLLNLEFPTTNLPHILRLQARAQQPELERSRRLDEQYDFTPSREMLEQEFSFVGVVYWPKMRLTFPGMFRSPMPGDSLAFTQVSVFLPLRRYAQFNGKWRRPVGRDSQGRLILQTVFDSSPSEWNLFNQNWTVRLTPATHPNLPEILRTQPPSVLAPQVVLPNLSGMTINDVNAVNTH